MNDLIPDKQAYQLNKRRMAWTALGMMIVSTIAVLIDPVRMAEADAVLMYGSLSALVGAYFGFSGGAVKKCVLVGCGSRTKQSASPCVPL